MKEQIYEINITLEMLEENPLINQKKEKKRDWKPQRIKS